MKKSFVVIFVLLLIGLLIFAGCKEVNNKVSDPSTGLNAKQEQPPANQEATTEPGIKDSQPEATAKPKTMSEPESGTTESEKPSPEKIVVTQSEEPSPEKTMADFKKLLRAGDVDGTSDLFLSYDEMNKLVYPRMAFADYNKYKDDRNKVLSLLVGEGDIAINYCVDCAISGVKYGSAETWDDNGNKLTTKYNTASTILNISSKGHYSMAHTLFYEYGGKWKIMTMLMFPATPK